MFLVKKANRYMTIVVIFGCANTFQDILPQCKKKVPLERELTREKQETSKRVSRPEG